MHHSHRATDAGKATSASLMGTSDSLSFNGRHPPFARANSGVTATTALSCYLRSLRHRRPSHWLWSVAGKSSGSPVSSGAYRKAHAQTTPIILRRACARPSGCGGGPLRNRKCSRVPAGFPRGSRRSPVGHCCLVEVSSCWGRGMQLTLTDSAFFFFFLANVSNILLIKTAARSVHAFNPRTGETESDESLIYRARSRTA